MSCDISLELSHQGGSNKLSQVTFSLRNKEKHCQYPFLSGVQSYCKHIILAAIDFVF